jgi:hypothetical protein
LATAAAVQVLIDTNVDIAYRSLSSNMRLSIIFFSPLADSGRIFTGRREDEFAASWFERVT